MPKNTIATEEAYREVNRLIRDMLARSPGMQWDPSSDPIRVRRAVNAIIAAAAERAESNLRPELDKKQDKDTLLREMRASGML